MRLSQLGRAISVTGTFLSLVRSLMMFSEETPKLVRVNWMTLTDWRIRLRRSCTSWVRKTMVLMQIARPRNDLMNSSETSSLNLACAKPLKASNKSGVSWRQTMELTWASSSKYLRSTGRMLSFQTNFKYSNRSSMKQESLLKRHDLHMTSLESKEISRRSIIEECSKKSLN